VVLRLLVSGAIVLIWISGHVVETHEGTRRTRTTRSSNSFKVDTQTVATVTCDNPWPYALAKGAGEEPSEAVQRLIDLGTAFASVLFMAAFASARRPAV
jgi:hypothetical protein